jgi:alkylation response protein AidB-like acyl-CoA dehydrogenase
MRDKVDRGIELTRDDFTRWMKVLSAKGWIATNWDEKDGGPGFTLAQKYIFEDEVFLGGAPRTIHFGTRMVGPVLLAYGTPEQKRRYLPKIVTSEEIWCQGYSEPGAGSDLAALKTAAVRDGDSYVVNGRKWFITGALNPECAVFIVMGKTDPDAERHRQQSMILVPRDTPGLTVVRGMTVYGYADGDPGGQRPAREAAVCGQRRRGDQRGDRGGRSR